MKAKVCEVEFLSVWAREEKAENPYVLPAHQLQAVNRVQSITLIRAIKAWARSEGRNDEDIFAASPAVNPAWPWSTQNEMTQRLSALAEAVSA